MAEHTDRIPGGEPPPGHVHPGGIPAPAHPSPFIEGIDQTVARRADHLRMLHTAGQRLPLSSFNRPWLRANDGSWRGQHVGGVPV